MLNAFAQTESIGIVQEELLPIGEVRYLRGKALRNGNVLIEGNKVFEGDTIRTLASSVVKIIFNNESLVTIAPESEMVLEEFEGADENLIHLLKGVLRAKVKNNPVNKENSLVIKSQTAALGVRGTEFQFTYNQINRISSVLTFLVSLPSRDYQALNLITLIWITFFLNRIQRRFFLVNFQRTIRKQVT